MRSNGAIPIRILDGLACWCLYQPFALLFFLLCIHSPSQSAIRLEINPATNPYPVTDDTLALSDDDLIWLYEDETSIFETDDDLSSSTILSDLLGYIPGDVTGRHLFRVQFSLPKASGYQADENGDIVFPGSPMRIYHQHRLSAGKMNAHLTQIKLPGEPFHGKTGFDFTSGHISLDNDGIVERIILGDYSLRFGQGLALWTTPSFGKGGTAHTAPYRRNHGARAYYSSDQVHYLRGIAATFRPLPSGWIHQTNIPTSITFFYSHKPRSSVPIDSIFVRPPSNNPYHRTENERRRRHNTRETIIGGHMRLSHPQGSLGITGYRYQLSHPVIPAHQNHPMQGQKNHIGSVDMIFSNRGYRFFFELAANKPLSSHYSKETLLKTSVHSDDLDRPSGGISWTGGIMKRSRRGIDWIVAGRVFGTHYWSEYTNAFGEGSRPINQRGVYLGYRFTPNRHLSLSGFFDRFFFPKEQRQRPAGSSGWEHATGLSVRPSQSCRVQLRIRYKTTERYTERQDVFGRLYRARYAETRLATRLQVQWHAGSALVFTSRADHVKAAGEGHGATYGYAFRQTIQWRISSRFRTDANWGLFETDGYQARLYLFEHDVSHSMASRMVYGTGRQAYLVARHQVFSWGLLEAKVSFLDYFDRPASGSGHTLTKGPKRWYYGFQLRVQY